MLTAWPTPYLADHSLLYVCASDLVTEGRCCTAHSELCLILC